MVWCPQDLPLVRIGVCSLVSLSLVVGMFVGDVFSLSLSQVLGKPKPLLGFGVPFVFMWTPSSTRTPNSTSTPRSPPGLCFFVRAGVVVGLGRPLCLFLCLVRCACLQT